MSCPKRYHVIGDFHKYYSGEKKAPVLTIVIGGNHEASNYFAELYHGGWLAPNIYYLGDVGVIRYGPYRIAGMSGIYKSGSYHKPQSARLPYDENEIKDVYHVRESDVSKLLQIKQPIDICLSHDWPRRIEWHGDYAQLFGAKPHFLESAKTDSLGSAPAEQVMSFLRPSYWFSGHMHARFSATVDHNKDIDIFKHESIRDDFKKLLPGTMKRHSTVVNKSAPKSVSTAITNTTTQFLALDKPGPGQEFLETLEINSCAKLEPATNKQYMEKTTDGKFRLHYDEEWLAIVRSSSDTMNNNDMDVRSTNMDAGSMSRGANDMQWIRDNITANGLLAIPNNFEVIAPVHDPLDLGSIDEQPSEYPNPQTEKLCQLLDIRNRFSACESVEDEASSFVTFG